MLKFKSLLSCSRRMCFSHSWDIMENISSHPLSPSITTIRQNSTLRVGGLGLLRFYEGKSQVHQSTECTYHGDNAVEGRLTSKYFDKKKKKHCKGPVVVGSFLKFVKHLP